MPAWRPDGGSERIWLTASGGPFLYTPKSQFSAITVEQALNHPTWKMGKRITIDSATLMNKGFEVIEACRLFNLPPETGGSDGASAIYNSFHGGVRGWQHTRSVFCHRYADADSVRVDLSGAGCFNHALPGHGLTTPRIPATGYGKIPLSRSGLRGRGAGVRNCCTQCRDEVAVAAFCKAISSLKYS